MLQFSVPVHAHFVAARVQLRRDARIAPVAASGAVEAVIAPRTQGPAAASALALQDAIGAPWPGVGDTAHRPSRNVAVAPAAALLRGAVGHRLRAAARYRRYPHIQVGRGVAGGARAEPARDMEDLTAIKVDEAGNLSSTKTFRCHS